ncbi:hypothetical protein ACFL4K_00855 [Candidatus Neomarinimicrobiota bacterium]
MPGILGSQSPYVMGNLPHQPLGLWGWYYVGKRRHRGRFGYQAMIIDALAPSRDNSPIPGSTFR